MRLNKTLCIIALIFSSFLFAGGCTLTTGHNGDIKEVSQILNKFKDITDVDIRYTIQSEMMGTNIQNNNRIIMKKVGDVQQAYFIMATDNSTMKMYYIDDYVYSEINGDYNVAESNGFAFNTINPVPTDLDFDNIEYDLDFIKNDDEYKYSLFINDENIAPYVEKLTGISFFNKKTEMVLNITVDRETGDPESINMIIDVTENKNHFTIDLAIKINAIGKDVVLNIPKSVVDGINDYKNGNVNHSLNPLYKDTLDGVVDYHYLGQYKNIVYDETTNKLAVLRTNSVDIYDATTFKKEAQLISIFTPVVIDADNGKLVIGYGTNHVKLYDLNTFIELKTVRTIDNVHELVIDDDVIIYANKIRSCDIIFHNINNDEKIIKEDLYQPVFTINHNDHILYVTETSLSSTDLIYFNTQNGEVLFQSKFSGYVKERVIFDGKFVHHQGKTYDSMNGAIISSNNLNQLYAIYSEFTPINTMFDNNEISFLGNNNHYISIYNNELDGYVYQYYMDYGLIIPLKDNYYLTLSGSSEYVAVVNINLINLESIKKDDIIPSSDLIELSNDGKLKTLNTTDYTKSIADGNYLYLLNEEVNELRVYDIYTFEKVYEERYLIKPRSIDAYEGRLVVGFGEAKFMRLYDINTWSYDIINTKMSVFHSIIYKDSIIYVDSNQHQDVFIYDLTTISDEPIGYRGSNISMAINRQDNVIYFGEQASTGDELAYFDLTTNKVFFSTSVYLSSSKVSFDGYFIHYDNNTFDKAGIKISDSNKVRMYQVANISSINTIFDNDVISIFTGIENNQIITYVYDLYSKSVVYSFSYNPANVQYIGNKLIFSQNSGNKVVQLSLNELVFPQPNPDPEPGQEINLDPKPPYINTVDGVVKYFNLGEYKSIKFDKTTNKLVVLRTSSLDIYDATTLKKVTQLVSLLSPKVIDIDDGKLVIGYGTNSIKLIDLATLNEIKTIQTSIDVFELVIDDDMVIYTHNDQWCDIVFHNINTNEKTIRISVYEPLFTINREDHILYVTETSISSTYLVYYNTQNGNTVFSKNTEYGYVKNRIIYDGEYVHHEGRTYDRINGLIISSNRLNRYYAPYSQFTPLSTLYDSETFAMLKGNNNDIALYNNKLEGYVYQFYMDNGLIIPLNDGYFLALSEKKEHVAIINTNLINMDIVDKDDEVLPFKERIEISIDAKVKTLFTQEFTASVSDDKYIYTLNVSSYELKVYDIQTLEKIREEKFLVKPMSIDAYDNRLIIGFGLANQIRLYDTLTWDYEIITTVDSVYTSFIYNDTIVYTSFFGICELRVYDLTTRTDQSLYSIGPDINMTINREDNIIYIGERSSISRLYYYDLINKKIIFNTSVTLIKSGIRFDGKFVYFNSYTYDETGALISYNEAARSYQVSGISNIKTIYDDESISIFTGTRNNESITVIYNLLSNSEIYSFYGNPINANLVGDKFIFSEPNNQIKVVELN